MEKKFKKYVWENNFCSPPPMNSDESILKSWLDQKMSRKPLEMGAIKNGMDDDYTDYEIKKIKELFTDEEINNLCPQDWKAELKKNSTIYISALIGVILILKFAINFIGLYYIFLIVFLIVWNLFLKSRFFGGISKLFGASHMVKNRSISQCYEMYKMDKNVVQLIILDSFLSPLIFYVVFLAIVS